MISKHFFEEIFPALHTNGRIILVIIGICTLSCIIAVYYPFGIPIFILGFFLIAFNYIFKVHPIQLFFAGLVLSRILTDYYGILISNVTVLFIILVFLSEVFKVLFKNEKVSNDSYLNVIIISYLILALNATMSIIYNSNISFFAIGEIAKYALSGIFIMLCFHLINNPQNIEKLFTTVLVMAILVATYGYYLVYKIGITAFIVVGSFVMHGVSGGMSNPGTLALVVLYPLPILISYLIFGGDSHKKRIYIFILIYLFPVWILWNSRGNYLFFLASFIMLLAFHKKKFKYYSIIISLSILAIISINLIPLLRQFLRLESGLTYRGDLWVSAFRMFAESPIFGKGPGYYSQFKYSYMDPGIGRNMVGMMSNSTPHNVLLLRAVDLGFGGVLAQVVIWIISLIALIRNSKYIKNSRYYYLYLGFGALVFGNMAYSMIDVGGSMIVLIVLAAMFKLPDIALKTEPD
jgi:O-antigen ligase